MTVKRRTVLGAAALASATPLYRPHAQPKPVVRIGVMNDQSGPYRDVNGPTGVICAQQAVQEAQALLGRALQPPQQLLLGPGAVRLAQHGSVTFRLGARSLRRGRRHYGGRGQGGQGEMRGPPPRLGPP